MIPALLLAPMMLTGWGVLWLYVWCLDWHDARSYAAHSAQRLVAWAHLEADVIAAERRLGLRHG